MGTENVAVRIRRGEQVHGPMTLEKANQLLAQGKLRETDLVSQNGGPWLPLKAGLRRQPALHDDDAPLIDESPLFSGPGSFDPNYVPLSDPDVTATGSRSNAAVPASQPKPQASRPPEPAPSSTGLSGSGELVPDDLPRKKPAPRSGTMPSRPSSGAIRSRTSSGSIPALPPADEAGMDALLQSLADDARKAPPTTPPRKLPPRR